LAHRRSFAKEFRTFRLTFFPMFSYITDSFEKIGCTHWAKPRRAERDELSSKMGVNKKVNKSTIRGFFLKSASAAGLVGKELLSSMECRTDEQIGRRKGAGMVIGATRACPKNSGAPAPGQLLPGRLASFLPDRRARRIRRLTTPPSLPFPVPEVPHAP
jgi:hypothetical protein